MAGMAMPHFYESVFAGDFDGDGNDELLIFDAGQGTQIVRLDGSLCGNFPQGGARPLCAWDCNGDGKAEVIRQGANGGIEAVDLQGRVVKTLPDAPLMAMSEPGRTYQLIGDADGDGKPELWLSPAASGGAGVVAVSSSGKVVAQDSTFYPSLNALVCDYYGTGMQVLVGVDYSGNLLAVGVGGTKTLGSVGGGPFGTMPQPEAIAGCLDINGDGKPDLLIGFDKYFDQAAGKLVHFKHRCSFHPPYFFSGSYVQFDADGDGVPETVYAGPDADGALLNPRLGGGGGLNGRLFIYQPRTQRTVYDEVIKDGYQQTAVVAMSHGKAHLVVPLQDKIEIYP
jgi:hypothetical protein